MAAVERELEQFLEQCRRQQFNEQEMRNICQPLVWHVRLKQLRRWAQWLLLPALLAYLLWSYCDTCAWTASAVGRLLLIQLLPYWNWTPYYNAQCLIERGAEEQPSKPSLGRHETLWENCVLCESLESIPTASNVSYSMLETQYLERGLPVIITDCQLRVDLDSLLVRILEKAPDLLASEPCDVSSNLLLRQLFNLDAALQKIPTTSAWHLQFRNCESKAVKASRLYSDRPYYYPRHLEPFYSSWLLMAHNVARHQTEIFVRGLIFVQQLSGHFEWRLQPKQPCDEASCPNLSLRLNEGECLVYSTDLWRLSYGLQQLQARHASIATLLEVNWQL
ncbi:uncharacterized protein LOC6560082 [Drosophila grimshawi]|uniref:GH19958 n=1 Tax=Drosophila grimshawi TaxID=7222 RepID=B4J8F9_DROGR|nr:uncharacterized protein LOC6560082 [Drosophila grimshawi]EDW02318.1 GH19958 [Drosophila grimshawi]